MGPEHRGPVREVNDVHSGADKPSITMTVHHFRDTFFVTCCNGSLSPASNKSRSLGMSQDSSPGSSNGLQFVLGLILVLLKIEKRVSAKLRSTVSRMLRGVYHRFRTRVDHQTLSDTPSHATHAVLHFEEKLCTGHNIQCVFSVPKSNETILSHLSACDKVTLHTFCLICEHSVNLSSRRSSRKLLMYDLA